MTRDDFRRRADIVRAIPLEVVLTSWGALRDRLRLYANVNRHVTDRSPAGFARAARQASDDATLHVEEFRIISLGSGKDLIAEFEKKANRRRKSARR